MKRLAAPLLGLLMGATLTAAVFILLARQPDSPLLVAILNPTTTPTMTPTPTPTATPTITPTMTPTPTITQTPTITLTPTPLTAKWKIQREASAMDDTESVFLLLDGDKMVYGTYSARTPALVLRCRKKIFDMYIVVGMEVESESNGLTTVRARLGKETPYSFQMGVSTDKTALFFGQSVDWLNTLLKYDTMGFEFTPAGAQKTETIFDLRGLGQAVKALIEGCPVLIPK